VLIRLKPGIKAPERVATAVIRIAREGRTAMPDSTARVEHRIPVEYGGAAGPDLGDVARIAGLDEKGVVAVHSSAVYTVAFVGFSPGFPYLVGLPAALQVARLSSPRTRVPKGSVAIAGPFAGIYPRESPGGWRLLGQTEIELFDCQGSRPALLAPGDTVRFVAG
jgi:KipI family sensor histidine kinase inhibitor